MVCPCCACTCDKTVTYSYYDSEPPGKFYAECPLVGTCDGVNIGSCAGEVLEGFIVERFRKACVGTKIIRAKLLAGSTVDDYGSIGGVSTSSTCGVLGVITGDHDVTDEVVIEDDGAFFKAKIPISITNHEYLGGPHGLASVTICWCCQEEDADGCVCFPPPPVCCCDSRPSVGTISPDLCEGTAFEPPASYDFSGILGSLVIEWCGLSINGANGYTSADMDSIKCSVPTSGTEHEGRSAYLRTLAKYLQSNGNGDYTEGVCGVYFTALITASMAANVHVIYPEYPGWDPVWRYASTVEYYTLTVKICNNGSSPTTSVVPIYEQSGFNECGNPYGNYEPCNRTPPVVRFVAAP